ncbi:hypothetical protein GCM10027059_22610 [Myceligenerans halotolerans]
MHAAVENRTTRRSEGAVVVVLHDGWYGCGTGSGHSNRRLVELLDAVLAVQVDMVVLPVRVDAASPHFDAKWHEEVTGRLGRGGRRVKVYPLENATGGRSRFGGMASFAELEEHVPAVLDGIMSAYERGLLLMLDVPFLGVAARIAHHVGWARLVLPRSSATLHCPDNTARTTWEAGSLRRAAARGVHVGAIAPFMRRHLVADLGVPDACVIDLTNGLTPADTRLEAAGKELLPEGVGEAGFVLALGRAVAHKGFEDLLDAWDVLADAGEGLPHLVVAATSERPVTPYQRLLAGRIRDKGLSASLITRYSSEARSLLAHPGVRAVVIPSRVEPFGRIPLEAYALGAGPVVATTAGGLADLVTDGETGFTCSPGAPDELALALRRALRVSPAQRARMRVATEPVLAAHDYAASLTRTLRTLIPWSLDTDAPNQTSEVSAVTSHGLRVLQVPEQCAWNPYVAAGENALADLGAQLLRPGTCIDSPSPPPPVATVDESRADVVHVHWPEKLAEAHGRTAAIEILRARKAEGAVVVQTIHNIAAHEPSGDRGAYLAEVDRLTDGIHVFSAEHERAARAARPELPTAVFRSPHPLLPIGATMLRRPAPGGLRMGCFGRLRRYKRIEAFASAFLEVTDAPATLLIAGHPDNADTGAALTALATTDPRIEYRPGFVVDDQEFWSALGEVDWIALPYAVLHSSGVLVAALQAGRRILSAPPMGGIGLYTTERNPAWWITASPFEHWDALRRWKEEAPHCSATPDSQRLLLPDWGTAAAGQSAFYARLLAAMSTRQRPPARLGAL